MPRLKKERKRLVLLQTRIDIENGTEFQTIARADGLAPATYLRRLVMSHLRSLKASKAVVGSVSG